MNEEKAREILREFIGDDARSASAWAFRTAKIKARTRLFGFWRKEDNMKIEVTQEHIDSAWHGHRNMTPLDVLLKEMGMEDISITRTTYRACKGGCSWSGLLPANAVEFMTLWAYDYPVSPITIEIDLPIEGRV